MNEIDQVQKYGATLAASGRLEIDYVICDVFSAHALAGNQLAVFPFAADLSGSLRAALAREMNYSESVFVTPSQAGADATLAIYTPTRELPFAGHPVLGTAAVLANANERDLLLRTTAQLVSVQVRPAGPARAEAWMEQPWPERVRVDGELIGAALGADPELAIVGYENGAKFALVDLGTPENVAAARPDLDALAGLEYGVLCFGGAGAAWKARMFGPGIGVSEDPATGSAAGPLAVHLHEGGRLPPDGAIEIEQGVEIGRPSRLHARLSGAAGDLRVGVGGHVVTVAHGRFSLPIELLELGGEKP